jgi:hypothetical protein
MAIKGEEASTISVTKLPTLFSLFIWYEEEKWIDKKYSEIRFVYRSKRKRNKGAIISFTRNKPHNINN